MSLGRVFRLGKEPFGPPSQVLCNYVCEVIFKPGNRGKILFVLASVVEVYFLRVLLEEAAATNWSSTGQSREYDLDNFC